MAPRPPKTVLRRALRARRAAREPSRSTTDSAALTAAILAHERWRTAKSVAAFVGVRGEPDTQPLLQAALDEGRRLWLPRVLHGTQGLSVLVEVADLSVLAPAGFGLLEPRVTAQERSISTVTPDGPIDLMLIPGLAFSSAGARIGFGAGHYDRLLAPIIDSTHPTRIGLCFNDFLDPSEGTIPTASHDVNMHHIATEAGVHRCRPQ